MVRALVSIITYIILLPWVVIFVVCHTLLWLLSFLGDQDGRMMQWAGSFWSGSLFKCVPGWSMSVSGRENIKRGESYVIVTNHRSMLDIPAIFTLRELWFKWVSKREVYKIPVFGWVLWQRNDIAIARGNSASTKEMMQRGCNLLSRGLSVSVFPEGTRSHDGEIHRYKDGAFYMAHDAGVSILPCVMDGTDRLFDGWKIARCKVRLRVLPPIPANEVVATEPKEMAKRVQAIATEALREMKSQQ